MQPAQYGIGAIDLFEDVLGYGPFSRIRIHIVQTRAGIAPTVHEYNREELEEKRLRLRAAAEEVYAGGVLQPSEKACRFCRASGDCLAYSEWSLVRLVGHFEDLEEALTKVDTLEAKPELLSGDQVAAILDKLSVVEAWIANMRSGAQKRALRGEPIPGRKLVLSTKHRKWLDENAALAALLDAGVARSDCIKESLFSPAQAEKALGKSHPVLADFVVIPPGDPVLVPETDKRPPWVPSSEMEFDDLDTEDANP